MPLWIDAERDGSIAWSATLTEYAGGQLSKSSRAMEYGITGLSPDQASPRRVMQVRRQRCLMETDLDYRRDVTFSGRRHPDDEGPCKPNSGDHP